MPVPVRVLGANGEQLDLVLNNTTNGQTFIENVPFVVTSILFDPKKDLISKNISIVLATENFKLNPLILYPNPVKNKLSLQIPDDISIEKTLFYNALGQKVKETTSATSWDVGDFSEGVYFMTMFTNEGTKQLQFVKN
jgi:hypothetical protein